MDAQRKTEIRHTIFDAVLEGKNTDVENLIQDDHKLLEETTEEGWTLLHVSVIHPNEKITEFLLGHCSDLSAKDSDGKTPLHWAAYRNVPFGIFNKLVSRIDRNLLNACDKYGRTPLHYVCLKDASCKEAYFERETLSTDLILKLHLLIRANVNLEILDTEGNTALHLLCGNIHNCHENEEINFDELQIELKSLKSKSLCGVALEMLLNAGGDHNVQNQYGMTALHLASKSICVEMVRLLLSRNPDGNIVLDASGNTAMSLIFTSVSTCLSLKYSVQPSNWFPLSDIKSRFEDTLRPVLKQMRPSVNIAKAVSGFTVLFYAMQNITSSDNVVKGLIGYGGADVKHRNFLGKSPLHYAARPLTHVSSSLRETLLVSWQNKVKLLLQNNAEVNAQDLFGNSPLHDAAVYCDQHLIQILISNGANVNLRNKFGATPLHMLCLNFDENNTPFTKEVTAPSDALSQLILAGADANFQDVHGSSALHYTVYSRNKDSVVKLLDLGADEGLEDESGLNPKQYSQSLGCYEIYNSVPGVSNDKNVKDENDDCFLLPVKMSNISAWLKSNMEKVRLSDDKIRKLLQSTDTDRLSNSADKNTVLKQLLALMTSVFDEVEQIDPRFKVTVELSGSTREGTKVEAPDEFDLLCFLNEFESICDIEEHVKDIVVCKFRKGIQLDSYKTLFDENGLLLGNKLTTALYLCIRKALSSASVWKCAPGLCLDSSKDDYISERDTSGIRCLYFRYWDATFKDLAVSCDIVPVIKGTQWWPSFAKQDGELVTPEIRANGCMVIAKPCMDVALSGESVRLLTHFKASVYLSECHIMLSLPWPIRQAYKLAKLLLKKRRLYPPIVEDSKAEGN